MSPTPIVPQPADSGTSTTASVPFNTSLIGVTERDENAQKWLIAVIPAYNEQIALGSVVLLARQYVDRVIVVDDGSMDRTSEVAKLAGADVIRLHVHTGKAYALLLGLRNAREIGCKAAIYIGHGGYSHIHDIPKIAARTLSGDADLVIGSHYQDSKEGIPFTQEIKRTIRRLPKRDTESLPLTDPLSDFRSFSRKALENLDFKTDGYNIETDIIIHLKSQALVIEETPLTNLSIPPPDPDWKSSVKVLAAMPAFNEEKYIAKTIIGTKKYVDKILVIDDGSTDATKAIAENLGALVIHHERNAGYGAALQDIFEKARELHVDALVILDADGQHNPDDVGRLLDALVRLDVDVVIGSRFLEKNDKKIPGYRKVGMKVLDGATKIAGVAEISDSQSGFRAYGKRAIDVINLTGKGMSAGSEILIQIADHNLKYVEVPINVRYDVGKTSTYNPISHGVSVLGKIIALISYRRPLPAFGIPGLILLLIAIAWGLFAIRNYDASGIVSVPLSLLSAVFLFIGLLMVIAGLILNAMIVIVRQQKR
jgi:glycosyltransferase involved in cell wall biosynthesis